MPYLLQTIRIRAKISDSYLQVQKGFPAESMAEVHPGVRPYLWLRRPQSLHNSVIPGLCVE